MNVWLGIMLSFRGEKKKKKKEKQTPNCSPPDPPPLRLGATLRLGAAAMSGSQLELQSPKGLQNGVVFAEGVGEQLNVVGISHERVEGVKR